MFLSHLFRAGCAAALMLLLPGCGSDDKPEAPLPKIESLTFEQTCLLYTSPSPRDRG